MEKEESLQQKNKIEESDKKSENGKPETDLKPEINNTFQMIFYARFDFVDIS